MVSSNTEIALASAESHLAWPSDSLLKTSEYRGDDQAADGNRPLAEIKLPNL
jgi:hypothetical protein